MEIQNGTLSPRHREAGLALYPAPADNSILNLIFEGHVIKSFGKTATAEEMHKEAEKWLRKNQQRV